MLFKPQFLGVLPDDRTRREKNKDYLFKEIVASADPVSWQEREPRHFPIRNQNGSSACVAFSAAKMLGVLQYANKGGRFVEFSPAFLYQKRANRNIGDGEGMASYDTWRLLRERGMTLDPLMPSDNLTEEAINAIEEREVYRDVADLFKVDNYVTYTAKKDFDAIAGTILKTGKGVMTWFKFDSNEWTTVPRIKTDDPSYHHSVCAVDAVVYKGEECIVIDDSWGTMFGAAGQRYITREFFENRNTYAAYPLSFKVVEDSVERPHYTFKYTMRMGMQNVDVKVMQDILKYEGLFPANVESTGYYGEITRKAVLAYQTKYQVASPDEIRQVNGEVCGPKTIAHLNSNQ